MNRRMKKNPFSNFCVLCMLLLAGTTFVGCQDDNPIETPSLTLNADVVSIALPSEGGEGIIKVTSPDVISVSASQSWCVVSAGQRSAEGITQVTVRADANTGTAARSALVDISCGNAGISVRVTQTNCPVPLKVTGGPLTFDEAGGKATLTIVSTTQPEVKVNCGWCHMEEGSIDDTHQTIVEVAVSRNFLSSSRAASVVVCCDADSVVIPATQSGWTPVEVAQTDAVTAEEASLRLGMGWNLGNQLDAHNGTLVSETAWGNPLCTQATFDGVRKAGFTSVRIPVTYLGHIGPAPDYVIDSDWLQRVVEVIGFAEKAGLNVITNIHHDGADSSYWLDIKHAGEDASLRQSIGDELGAVWTQIAEALKDKGDWLIFEPFNELQDGGWGYGANLNDGGAQYRCIDEWNQVFVNAVRSTGGNNATRWLSAVGMCANAQLTMDNLTLPTDYTTQNRLYVGVHFYDPSDYTLTCVYSEWGHTGSLSKSASWGNEPHVRDYFDALSKHYFSLGIPVYVGEAGSSFRSDEREQAFHKYYMEYVWRAAALAHVPLFVWDNGAEGGGSENHCYLRHDNGDYIAYSKEVIDLMYQATFSTDADYTLESIYERAPEKQINEDDARLAEFLQYLCGFSSRDWTWDESEFVTDGGYNGDAKNPCWGNAAFLGASADKVYGTGNQMWWGINADAVEGQIDYYNSHPELYPQTPGNYAVNEGKGAVMTFTQEGNTLTKSSGGTGTFTLSMAEGRASAAGDGMWSIGQLTTTGDGILFPCQINTGKRVQLFDVMRLDDSHLMLSYASEGAAAWSEATYWRFKRK